jgi:hypothetical protein
MVTATQTAHRKQLDAKKRSGEEGLVFLRDIAKRSAGPKIEFPVPDAGQLMTVEAGT